MPPHITPNERHQIIKAYKKTPSFVQLAKDFSQSRWTIGRIIRKYEKTGSVATEPRLGRPRKHQVKYIIKLINHNILHKTITATTRRE